MIRGARPTDLVAVDRAATAAVGSAAAVGLAPLLAEAIDLYRGRSPLRRRG